MIMGIFDELPLSLLSMISVGWWDTEDRKIQLWSQE